MRSGELDQAKTLEVSTLSRVLANAVSLHPSSLWGRLLGFIALSGIGWVLDTLIYLGLVSAGLRVMMAGAIGGLCGASFAFLSSSRHVFLFQGGTLQARLAIYLLYTVALIVLSSYTLEGLSAFVIARAHEASISLSPTAAALLAKVAVTPFLLLCNFVVARGLLQTG